MGRYAIVMVVGPAGILRVPLINVSFVTSPPPTWQVYEYDNSDFLFTGMLSQKIVRF